MVRIEIPYVGPTVLMLILALAWPSLALADTYGASAHGNTDFGVYREGAVCPGTPCDQGNCAHCHASYAPAVCSANPHMLFYDDWVDKTDLLCFECHSASTEEQQVGNYPYCVTFGGRAEFYGNIKKQFNNEYSKFVNCGSRHHLTAIRDFMIADPYGWGFSTDPDPCVACHNPHADQKNYPVAIVGGKLNTAIRRPAHYRSTDPAEILWGDDGNERMDDRAALMGDAYQAPYYGSPGNPTTGPFEPADNDVSDGSNLPDYVTFCLDCHQDPQYDPERNETVRAIDWNAERHGGWPSNTCDAGETYEGDPFESSLKPPYDTYEPDAYNFVLSCLDCHEPHGTKKRLHLIRRMINGEEVGPDNGECDEPTDWANICARCHYLTHPGPTCTGCHYHGIECWHPACIGDPCF